ncbi:MAG: M15 family metallopeptidase [Clostridia bacterium]|nr:M15 family metallopeptidase [Clostridia bacterium]
MRRHRKFPLISAVLFAAIVAMTAYRSYLDVDLLGKAFSHMGKTMSGVAASIRLIGSVDAAEDFVFRDAPSVPESPAEPPAPQKPMLVNGANRLPDGYVPADLVRMRDYCDAGVVTIKGSEIEGDRQAVDALMVMFRAAIAEGVTNWQISAGYRSVGYQQKLWDDRAYEYRKQGLSSAEAQRATAQYVAVPGASEHHTGLAFDVTVPGESFPLTRQSKWLAENCWDYGFVIRFTEEKQHITGINAEPWHIRYVGNPHAIEMRDNNWCLEEYLAQIG